MRNLFSQKHLIAAQLEVEVRAQRPTCPADGPEHLALPRAGAGRDAGGDRAQVEVPRLEAVLVVDDDEEARPRGAPELAHAAVADGEDRRALDIAALWLVDQFLLHHDDGVGTTPLLSLCAALRLIHQAMSAQDPTDLLYLVQIALSLQATQLGTNDDEWRTQHQDVNAVLSAARSV